MSDVDAAGIVRLVEASHDFLPPAADVPFWDQPVCPAGLAPLMFPETPAGMRLYFIVDAALRSAARGVFDLDVVAADLPARSLFLARDGDDTITQTAPWLIDLTEAHADRAAARFLQELVATGWQAETGLFLVTRAPFDALFDHLRRLTRLECDWKAGWLFFRFWDPAVAAPYFRAIATRPERLRQMLMLRDGTPIDVIAGGGEGKAIAFHMTGAEDTAGLPEPLPIRLDQADRLALAGVTLLVLEKQLGRWLADTRPETHGKVPPERLQAAGHHAVQVGQALGFVAKDDYAYLTHMMATLGGFFHQSGVPEGCIAILNAPEGDRHLRLRRVFMEDFLTTPMGCIAMNRPAILADLLAMPGAPRVTFDAMKAFLERQFTSHRQATGRFMQAVWKAHDADAIAEEDRVAIGLLSLFYGLRFYDDPFHPLRDPALTGPERIADAVARGWSALLAPPD